MFLILLGFFAREDDPTNPGQTRMASWFRTLMVVVMVITILIVLFGSFSDYGFSIGYSSFGNWLRFNWGNVLGVLVVIGLLVAVFRRPGNNNLPQRH